MFNMDGEIIGINSAIFSPSGGSVGIGFAIPAEMVRRVVDSAINEGRIVRPWLGLKGQAVTSDIAKTLDLDRPVGMLVTEIYPKGPADKAKIRKGDVVLKIDGREVYDEAGLKFLAATLKEGVYARLEVTRNGKARSVDVRLEAPPGATDSELIVLKGPHPLSGAEVVDLSPALADSLRRDLFDKGVMINRIARGSYAYQFGVRPGDRILEVNAKPVKDVAALEAVLSNPNSQGLWMVVYERNGRSITRTVRMDQ